MVVFDPETKSSSASFALLRIFIASGTVAKAMASVDVAEGAPTFNCEPERANDTKNGFREGAPAGR